MSDDPDIQRDEKRKVERETETTETTEKVVPDDEPGQDYDASDNEPK